MCYSVKAKLYTEKEKRKIIYSAPREGKSYILPSALDSLNLHWSAKKGHIERENWWNYLEVIRASFYLADKNMKPAVLKQ